MLIACSNKKTDTRNTRLGFLQKLEKFGFYFSSQNLSQISDLSPSFD